VTRAIRVFDTTLRDGEQAPGASIPAHDKLRIAEQLAVLGVDTIEAGFAAASLGEFAAVHDIAASVRGVTIATLARAVDADIDAASRALAPAESATLHVFIATSDIHLERKLRITRDECLARIDAAVRRARRACDRVEFSAEDATRTDREFLVRAFLAAVAAGAQTVNVPDTVVRAAARVRLTRAHDP
jgi:2-isopropylmalate synthase